jgi:hypothetical protein
MHGTGLIGTFHWVQLSNMFLGKAVPIRPELVMIVRPSTANENAPFIRSCPVGHHVE